MKLCPSGEDGKLVGRHGLTFVPHWLSQPLLIQANPKALHNKLGLVPD